MGSGQPGLGPSPHILPDSVTHARPGPPMGLTAIIRIRRWRHPGGLLRSVVCEVGLSARAGEQGPLAPPQDNGMGSGSLSASV